LPTEIGGSPISYFGNPVLTSPKLFLVFWAWPSDPVKEAPVLTNFLTGLGGSPYLNILTQYYEETGTTKTYITNPKNMFGGAWTDPSPEPVPSGWPGGTPALQAEVARASAHFGFNANALYVLALPQGYDACQAGHGSTTALPHMAYAIIPYQSGFCQDEVNHGKAGLFDAVTLFTGHEVAEALTDPYWDQNEPAWIAPNPNGIPSFFEVGDVCENANRPPYSANETFSTGTFVVQALWSWTQKACVFSAP
jgi:hypothetical protein